MCVLLAHDITAPLHQVAECETEARKWFITAEAVKQSVDAGLFFVSERRNGRGKREPSAFSSFARQSG